MTHPTKQSSKTPLVLSLAAIVISFASFLYAARTYSVNYRPYVGIVQCQYQLQGTPPTGISWTFVVQNTGSVPAVVTTQVTNATITTDKETHLLPLVGSFGRTKALLLQKATMMYSGAYNEADHSNPIPFTQLVDGTARLTAKLDLQYQSPSWFGSIWPAHYHCSTQLVFWFVNRIPQGWSITDVNWD